MRLKTFFQYSTIPIARVLCLLCPLLLAPCSLAQAQQPQKVFRIGYLSSRDPATESARSEAIRLALRVVGYVEGQNVAIVYRYGDSQRTKENAAELVGLKLDLIVVAAGYGVIQVVKDATKTIPIVLVGEGLDPSKAVSLKALPVREAISPASQTFLERLEENALSG